jgi:hypothetical protein
MAPIVIRSQPGVIRDTTRFNCAAHTDAIWCRWGTSGLPEKIRGYRRLSESLLGPATAIHRFSRNGETYFHVGSSQGIQQIRVNAAGVVTSVVNRTPSVLSTNSQYAWHFAVMYDPVVSNNASIIAHSPINLDQMDTDTQRPAFFGDMTGSGALVPVSAPVGVNATTVATVTGDTTNGSNVITNLSSTTALRYGQTITGSGIPAGAYIASVDSATQITLATGKNATATAGGVTLTSSVGGSCGGIVALYPYLFFYGSSGRILHSTPQNFNDFWGTGSNEAYITGQKIVRAMSTRGGSGNNPTGLFWSLDSLIRASFVGGDSIFNFDTVSDAITVMSPRSIVEYDGAHFWLGVDRFYLYAGTVRELPNAHNLDYLLKNINEAYKSRSFAFRNARHGEIWFCVPLEASEWPNHAFVFNVRGNFWYDTPLPESGRSAAEPALTFPYPVMSGVDATEGGNYKFWQHETGVDKVDGGVVEPIRSYFQTGDISLLEGQQPQDKEVQVLKIEPDFQQAGEMSVTVIGNVNARAQTVEETAVTFTDDPDQRETIVHVKATRRQMRFRFESNTQGGDYRAGKTLAHIAPASGRST